MKTCNIYTVTVYTPDNRKKVCNYLDAEQARSRADAVLDKLITQVASSPKTDGVMLIKGEKKSQVVGLRSGNPVCTAGVILYEAPLVF